MKRATRGVFFNDIHDDGVTKSTIACSARAHPSIAIDFTTSSHRSQRMKELKNRYLATHVGWLVRQVPGLLYRLRRPCFSYIAMDITNSHSNYTDIL